MRAIFGLAAILALALPNLAAAQRWDEFTSIELDNIDYQLRSIGESAPSTQRATTVLLLVQNGKLISSPMSTECQSNQDFRGWLAYPIKGGQLSDSGSCDMTTASYHWHVDYNWSSTASWNNGRMVLKSEGTGVKTTLRGCRGNWCTDEIEFVEQAVLRITARTCAVESYRRVDTLKSGNGATVVSTLSSNTKSRCRLVDN